MIKNYNSFPTSVKAEIEKAFPKFSEKSIKILGVKGDILFDSPIGIVILAQLESDSDYSVAYAEQHDILFIKNLKVWSQNK